jgi:hypothetical protein
VRRAGVDLTFLFWSAFDIYFREMAKGTSIGLDLRLEVAIPFLPSWAVCSLDWAGKILWPQAV